MPIVLIILGAMMVDLGFRGTAQAFAQQLGKDFDSTEFLAWIAALTIIGAIGFYSPLRRVSDIFMALVIFGLLFSNEGVIAEFVQAVRSPPAPSSPNPLPNLSSGGSSASGGGIGGTLEGLGLKAATSAFGVKV